MTKRALIIGSATGGLLGVGSDVQAVDLALRTRGFATRTHLGPDATRAGILAAYGSLIDQTTSGDAAVVYYSGHGGFAPNPDYRPMDEAGAVLQRDYQFIVPTDIDQSSEDDFRGITDIEMSLLLARLTQRTKNVTVILDCCHAARMSRDLRMTPKALPRPWFLGIATHLARLRQESALLDNLHVESNPFAVRLVAAGQTQSAYEYDALDGQRKGLFTEALLAVLEDTGQQHASWRSIGQRVQRRVLDIVPGQRPDVEGPTNRVPFTLENMDESGVLTIRRGSSGFVLEGGRLVGVEAGDEYALVAPDGDLVVSASSESAVRATVTWVEAAQAGLEVQPAGGWAPDAARAVLVRKTPHRSGVRVTGDGPIRERLVNAITRSVHLRVAEDAESVEPFARVEIVDGALAVREASGLLLGSPIPIGEGAEHTAVRALTTHARAQAVLSLTSGIDSNQLVTPFELELGRVQSGRPQPLPDSGALVFNGDPLYLRLHNPGTAPVYCSVFDVGLTGEITLITAADPSGLQLQPGQDYVLGASAARGLVGMPVEWPSELSRDDRRTETLVAIISDVPQDLRALETRTTRSVDLPAASSALERLVAEVGQGATRDMRPPAVGAPEVRYAVRHLTFVVDPGQALERDATEFLIDDRPDLSVIYRVARSASTGVEAVAIRLTDLIVHSNRALFSTNVRIDTAAITGAGIGDSNARTTYHMQTARFPRVSDGERLPMDNLLLFYGPVAGFLDVAVWVSRDEDGSPTLSELIDEELNSAQFKGAATTLLALAVAAPQAALVIAGIGAAATICNISSRLLSAAVGKSIGLYRTSLLAAEGFSVGRHPSTGLMRAQDFSFGYEIVDIGS